MEAQPILDKIKELFPETEVSVEYRQEDGHTMSDFDYSIRKETESSGVDIHRLPWMIRLENTQKIPERIDIPPYVPASIWAYIPVPGWGRVDVEIYLKQMEYKFNGTGLPHLDELEKFLRDSGYMEKRS